MSPFFIFAEAEDEEDVYSSISGSDESEESEEEDEESGWCQYFRTWKMSFVFRPIHAYVLHV